MPGQMSAKAMLDDFRTRFRGRIDFQGLIDLWQRLPEPEKKQGYDRILKFVELMNYRVDVGYLWSLDDWRAYRCAHFIPASVEEMRFEFIASLYDEKYYARWFLRNNHPTIVREPVFLSFIMSELLMFFRRIISNIPRKVRYLKLRFELERSTEKWPRGSSKMHKNDREKTLGELDRDLD